ncbi:MAG: DUF885 family protein [Gemmatimonadetes bacterium]|nr:DUF885 family protein [Gemmatimonadota bacterium]
MGDAPNPVRCLDRFFATYYARRPVSATFIGVHDHDHAWPDCSEEGLGDWLGETRALHRELEGCAAPEDPDVSWDLQVASGFLETQAWELGSAHGPTGNPAFFTGEAAFGVIALLLTDFAPLADRVSSLIARLAALPAFLEQGEALLRAAPRAWTARAGRECGALLALLERGLPMARAAWPEGVIAGPDLERVEEERVRAAAAAERFRDFLRGLPDAGETAASAGAEAMSLHLKRAHFLERSVDDLAQAARDELRWAQEAVQRASAPSEPPSTTLEGPGAGTARYQEEWDAVRRKVDDLDLLTWPDFPIRYVHRPPWVREAAEDLYFLYYRAPAAIARPPVHEYLVPPVPPADSVIRLNHVIHHGGVGHHVQNWHAYRAPSRVGRMAAVDCASRTALLAGGTMAEGWACYATDLMGEVGFLTPWEEYLELRGRVRMCARAVVDLRLHRGDMTLSEACDFYQSQAGMAAPAARAEAVKNSMFPGGAVMYLMGRDAIHGLRERIMAIEGKRFSLRRFHDRFLAHGSLPVALIAERMSGEALEEVLK